MSIGPKLSRSEMKIFEGIAEIYEAGAQKSRQWEMNLDRQQEAEVLETMARKARVLARGQQEHNIVVDTAGFGNHHRLTCRTQGCNGATLIRQPYMTMAQWYEARSEFDVDHPHTFEKRID